MPSISLLIPAYNEEASLAEVAERALRALRAATDDYELIMLDDASRDRTLLMMEAIRGRDPAHISVLRHPKNLGIARSFEDLYRAATKEYVFLIPGDGQYPPEALREIVPLLGRYDIVVCRRTYKHYTPYRHAISACFRWLPRLLFGIDLHDPGSTKCMKREIIAGIPVCAQGVFVEAERLIRASRRGYRIGTVDIVQEPRRGGKARGASLREIAHAMGDLLRLWMTLVLLRRAP
jgi:glycosyltransferase involved in cell wall biosynthesis